MTSQDRVFTASVKKAAYPSMDAIMGIVEDARGMLTLDQLVKRYEELNALCEASIDRHERMVDITEMRPHPSKDVLQSDSIRDSSLVELADVMSSASEERSRKVEEAEIQVYGLQCAMMDLEARVFDYHPVNAHDALRQIRFLCDAADYFDFEELAVFAKSIKRAVDVLWNDGAYLERQGNAS